MLSIAFRIHGQKVAEMPLIATRFKYRRKGMCRLLVSELEKVLSISKLLFLKSFVARLENEDQNMLEFGSQM